MVSIDAQTTSGGIFIDEADGVTLGTVTTGNGGGDIGITAGGAMTLAQAVTTAGSGKIDLTTTVGNLQVNAEVRAGGGLSLDAAGRLLIAAAVSGSQVDLMGGAGIEHTADGDVTSGGTLTATTQAGDIGMADGTVYSAGGDVNLTAANDVALGRIETGIDNTIVVTATNGAISDNTAGEGAGNENLVCCNIILTAASGIGATGEAADIDVTAGKIITATGSGGVYLAEIDTGQCGEPTDSGSTEVNTTVPDTPAPDPTGPETVDSDTTAPDTTGPDIASPDGTGPDIPVSEPPRSGDIPSDTIALQVLLFQETSNSRLQLTPGVFNSLADAYAIPDYEADGELYVVHLNGANESIWEQSGGCDDEEESAAEEE